MTAHSVQHSQNLPALARRSSRPGQGFSVPTALVNRLSLDYEGNFSFCITDALSKAKHDGVLDTLPRLAADATAALAPVEAAPLIDRLTLLGMSMANGRDRAQIDAWLHETVRLLSDLPQGVLFEAIDECVKEPGRVFVPSVGEIREKASDRLRRQERIAARLNWMVRLIDQGVEIPDWETLHPNIAASEPQAPFCTAEEAAAILAEFGLKSSLSQGLAGLLKPEEQKTRQQMVSEGREPPPLKPREDSKGIYV